ncbi:HipA domain-containing protein [Alkalispirochaeta americana]|uniref:HipA domain-containing protein n=1 Tax=Alkalispirochaeta americana TaxID=159291 RepID=UPI000B95054C
MFTAPDAHARSFSIFLEPGGSFRLTSLYDVLSGRPVIGNGSNRISIQRLRMAMAVTGKTARHWIATARREYSTSRTAAAKRATGCPFRAMTISSSRCRWDGP